MGKKRKAHEVEEDREPAAYGGLEEEEGRDREQQQQHDGGGTGGRVASRVDPETVSYLEEVARHVESVTDAEERELLVGNVLEEVAGKELRIASDAVTSWLLEQLLAGAPAPQLMQFMQAFTSEDAIFSLAGSAFGSHVAEKVLGGLHAQADALDLEHAAALEELLSGMVGAIGGHLYDYVLDKHATHVARALLVAIAGRDVLPPGPRRRQGQQQPDGGDGDGEGGGGGGGRPGRKAPGPAAKSALREKLEGSAGGARGGGPPPPPRFPALLRRLAKMLPIHDAQGMAVLGKNSCSGPFVQAVLRAAAGDEQLLMLLLPPVLGVDSAKASAAEPGQLLAGVTDSHAGRLLRDECYSRLLEVAVAVMPPPLAAEFHQRFLKGRLLPLTHHHSANFVVQAWLAAARTGAQVQAVLDELQHQLADLLRRRRSGVVAALVAAAARAGPGPHQPAALSALSAALAELPQWQGSEGTDYLAPALLTLDTSAAMGAAAGGGRGGGGAGAGRLSTPGAAILATILLQFPRKVAAPFTSSVASLSPHDAARAARDPAGSRALQALVEGGAGREAKARLLAALRGAWGDVSLQPAGSFFLEKAYAWADMEQKEAIVSEVATRQSTLLGGCSWGALLSRNLCIEAYLRSPEEWRKRAASTAAAKREFEQLLAEGAPGGHADAAGGGGKKRKRQKQQQQQQGEDQEEPQRQSHSSRKERKRAKLQAASAAAAFPDEQDAAAAAAAAAADAAAASAGRKQPALAKRAGGKKRRQPGAEPDSGVGAEPAEPDKGNGGKEKKQHRQQPPSPQANGALPGGASGATERKHKRKRESSLPGAGGPGGRGPAVPSGAARADDLLHLLGVGFTGGGGSGGSGGSGVAAAAAQAQEQRQRHKRHKHATAAV